MAKAYLLSESDRQVLLRFLGEARARQLNTQNRPEVPEEQGGAPEVYIARVPSSGIAAVSEEAGTSTWFDFPGTSTAFEFAGTGTYFEKLDNPGAAECDIYQILDGELSPTQASSKTVYNILGFNIPPYSWVIVVRDKYGTWYAVYAAPPTYPIPLPGNCFGTCLATWNSTTYTWSFSPDPSTGTYCLGSSTIGEVGTCSCSYPLFCGSFDGECVIVGCSALVFSESGGLSEDNVFLFCGSGQFTCGSILQPCGIQCTYRYDGPSPSTIIGDGSLTNPFAVTLTLIADGCSGYVDAFNWCKCGDAPVVSLESANLIPIGTLFCKGCDEAGSSGTSGPGYCDKDCGGRCAWRYTVSVGTAPSGWYLDAGNSSCADGCYCCGPPNYVGLDCEVYFTPCSHTHKTTTTTTTQPPCTGVCHWRCNGHDLIWEFEGRLCDDTCGCYPPYAYGQPCAMANDGQVATTPCLHQPPFEPTTTTTTIPFIIGTTTTTTSGTTTTLGV